MRLASWAIRDKRQILGAVADVCYRYVPQMNGVLLAHWEHEFLDDTVKIINECPFGVCEVQFRSVLWAPKAGQRLCAYYITLSVLNSPLGPSYPFPSGCQVSPMIYRSMYGVNTLLSWCPPAHVVGDR